MQMIVVKLAAFEPLERVVSLATYLVVGLVSSGSVQ